MKCGPLTVGHNWGSDMEHMVTGRMRLVLCREQSSGTGNACTSDSLARTLGSDLLRANVSSWTAFQKPRLLHFLIFRLIPRSLGALGKSLMSSLSASRGTFIVMTLSLWLPPQEGRAVSPTSPDFSYSCHSLEGYRTLIFPPRREKGKLEMLSE